MVQSRSAATSHTSCPPWKFQVSASVLVLRREWLIFCCPIEKVSRSPVSRRAHLQSGAGNRPGRQSGTCGLTLLSGGVWTCDMRPFHLFTPGC